MSTTINERFVTLIKAVNMNTNSFAKSIDKAYTSVEAICKSKTKPSYDLLESVFLKYPQLSRDWLLMGDGEMFRTEPIVKQDAYLHDHLQSLEGNFARLAAQLESKDQQIANLQESQKSLQRMLESVLGKSEGVTYSPLSIEETEFETMFCQYRQRVLGTQLPLMMPAHRFGVVARK